MSAEIPTPKNMPRKRRQPAVPKEALLTEDGWLKGKAHLRAADAIDCNCTNTHELLGLVEIFNAGITTPKAIFKLYHRYADMSQKAHNAYVEQGYKRVWQLAEGILKDEH